MHAASLALTNLLLVVVVAEYKWTEIPPTRTPTRTPTNTVTTHRQTGHIPHCQSHLPEASVSHATLPASS